MKLSAEFLSTGRNNTPEQAATVARIAIEIAGINVTEFRVGTDDNTNLHVTMPAYVLAEGLAQRWWTFRGGRGKIVRFRSFREGFALPDIVVTTDRETMVIEAKRYKYDNPDVTFINSEKETTSSDEFISEIKKFITSTTAVDAVSDSLLAQYVVGIRQSEDNVEEREWCLAAGALGLDPYAVDEAEESLIERAAILFEGEQLLEFLSGLEIPMAAKAVEWVEKQEAFIGERTLLPELRNIAPEVRRQINRDDVTSTAWDLGYEAARRTRAVLNKSPADRIKTVTQLARSFGSGDFLISRTSVQGLRAVIDHSSPYGTKVVVGGGRPKQSELFSLARGIGDSIVFNSSSRTAITDNETYRQAVGRAFAAELLAPAEIVLELRRKGWSEDDIALEFGVSGKVVFHQIDNQRRTGAAY